MTKRPKHISAPDRFGILQPFVFFREGHWYVVEIPFDQVLANVELNPGTIRVEDIQGNIVWRPQ